MDESDGAQPSKRSQRGLDWLNFFIADAETGFGPFVALYLASLNWSQGLIGLLLSTTTLAGIVSQVPGGALVDAAASKRLLIGCALAAVAVSGLIFALFPSPVIVFAAAVMYGGTGGIIRPALAAIGLGLVGHGAFSGRLGRNQRYDAFGNAVTAGLMGGLAHLTQQRTVFFVAAALCIPAIGALAGIRGTEIDYARARSAKSRERPREADPLHAILRNRPLLVFIGTLVLFQLANASVMPLASGRLGHEHQRQSELVTAGLVVMPQVVSAVIAPWVARRADRWGRKPLLLMGFGILPIQAALFAVTPGPWYLVGFEALGGLTAAAIGILTPLVIADVTRGTGRYNLAQGVTGTATSAGAAFSTLVTGYIAQLFGYAIGFFVLAALGIIGLGWLYWLLPETKRLGPGSGSEKRRPR